MVETSTPTVSTRPIERLNDIQREKLAQLGEFEYEPSPEDYATIAREFKSDFTDGQGIFYEGEVAAGTCIKDGRGVAIFADGSYYEGYWQEN